MLRKIFATCIVAFALVSLSISTVDARGRGHHSRWNGGHAHHGTIAHVSVLDTLELTDEQRATIDTTIDTLIAADTNREDIRVAVAAHLIEFGIEEPLALQSKLERQLATLELTDAQRAEIDALIAEQRAAGATEDAVRAAVVERLTAVGVAVPTYLLGHLDRLLSTLELTDEQIADIQAMVAGLREADATKSEIREAIQTHLEAIGVELPAHTHAHHGHGFHFFHIDLTEEQRADILAEVAALEAADAERQEIREAVKAMLVEWGIIEPAADAAEGDAAADLAIVDGEIQGAPSAQPVVNLKLSSWGALKSGR